MICESSNAYYVACYVSNEKSLFLQDFPSLFSILVPLKNHFYSEVRLFSFKIPLVNWCKALLVLIFICESGNEICFTLGLV